MPSIIDFDFESLVHCPPMIYQLINSRSDGFAGPPLVELNFPNLMFFVLWIWCKGLFWPLRLLRIYYQKGQSAHYHGREQMFHRLLITHCFSKQSKLTSCSHASSYMGRGIMFENLNKWLTLSYLLWFF